jgi:hypothetical protein
MALCLFKHFIRRSNFVTSISVSSMVCKLFSWVWSLSSLHPWLETIFSMRDVAHWLWARRRLLRQQHLCGIWMWKLARCRSFEGSTNLSSRGVGRQGCILVASPTLLDGLWCCLLEVRNSSMKGISFAHQEELREEWRRTLVSCVDNFSVLVEPLFRPP